jgi:hypothetical protein
VPARQTTTQRGLGWAHQQQVAALKRRHIDGTPCWWCGEGMYLSQPLDGDHSIARAHGGTVADRLLHRACNIERGDGRRDHLRPALGGKADEQLVEDRSRWCVLQW